LTLTAFGQQVIYAEEGIYVLNPAKSTLRGPEFKTQVLYNGKETITVVGFERKPFTAVFPNERSSEDGQPRPVTGGAFDAQAVTRLDPTPLKPFAPKMKNWF
jgi:hypothetical protein